VRVLVSSSGVEILQKLKQVEDNAWMLFNELPPCGARTRALHVFLDAKDLKSRIEKLEFGDRARTPESVTESPQ
jgi:hypothetical protein